MRSAETDTLNISYSFAKRSKIKTPDEKWQHSLHLRGRKTLPLAACPGQIWRAVASECVQVLSTKADC